MSNCNGKLEDCGAITYREYLDGGCAKCNKNSLSSLKSQILKDIDDSLNNGLHWKSTAREIVADAFEKYMITRQ